MKKLMVAVCAALMTAGAFAAEKNPETPFALGLATPLELPGANWDVVGLRLDLLWGRHANATGFQFGTLANVIDRQMTGLQLGFVNSAKTLHGIQIGAINFAEDGSDGIQIGVVNVMNDGRFPVMPIFNMGF